MWIRGVGREMNSGPTSPIEDCQVTIDTLRLCMIRIFRHRGLKRLFLRGDCSVIQPDLIDRVGVVLALLDVARSPLAMRLPPKPCP